MDRITTGNVSAGFEGIAQMLLEQKKLMECTGGGKPGSPTPARRAAARGRCLRGHRGKNYSAVYELRWRPGEGHRRKSPADRRAGRRTPRQREQQSQPTCRQLRSEPLSGFNGSSGHVRRLFQALALRSRATASWLLVLAYRPVADGPRL